MYLCGSFFKNSDWLVVLICNCPFRKNLTEDWLWGIVPGSPQKTLGTGSNNLLWHSEFCSGYFWNPPVLWGFFFGKNLELEVIKTSPTLLMLSIFHFLSYSCVLYSLCNESLAGYYYYLRPFLLFLFFQIGVFFCQFSDVEKLEKNSKTLAKFIKFYARKPEISQLLFWWINEKKLKKKLTLSIWGINSFSQFYEASKNLQIIMPKYTENCCQN
jgi:hypothetical protein